MLVGKWPKLLSCWCLVLLLLMSSEPKSRQTRELIQTPHTQTHLLAHFAEEVKAREGKGGKNLCSQIDFNSCLNGRSTSCGFKKCSSTSQLYSDLVCDFWKFGPTRAKIGKYIEICMENGQKSSKKLITFLFLLQFT